MLLAKIFHQNHQAVLAAVSINGLNKSGSLYDRHTDDAGHVNTGCGYMLLSPVPSLRTFYLYDATICLHS